MRVIVSTRKRQRPKGWIGMAVGGLGGVVIGAVRVGIVATTVAVVLAYVGLLGFGWAYPRLYAGRSRRRSGSPLVLSAPASMDGASSGRITVGPDRIVFAPARRGEPVDVACSEVDEVEVARMLLVSATRAWVRTGDGREKLFTITAPIRAVVEALGEGRVV